MWGRVVVAEPLPSLAELDTYSFLLGFDLLTNAPREELDEYFRYLPDTTEITAFSVLWLTNGLGGMNERSNASSPPNLNQSGSEDDEAAFNIILGPSTRFFSSMIVLDGTRDGSKQLQRFWPIKGQAVGDTSTRADIQAALNESLSSGHNTLLLAWLDAWFAAHKTLRPIASMPCVPGTDGSVATAQAKGTADAGFFPSIRLRQGPRGRWNRIRPPRRGFSYRP